MAPLRLCVNTGPESQLRNIESLTILIENFKPCRVEVKTFENILSFGRSGHKIYIANLGPGDHWNTNLMLNDYCSDFRYESNGIFVLGWVFFLQTIFDFLTSHF